MREEAAEPGSRSRTARSDEELARVAGEGDRTALEELVTRYYPYVHAVCRRILRNPSDVEEARQDALYLVAAGIGRYSGRSSFKTWIHRVAVNASLDKLRRIRRVPDLVEFDDEHAAVPHPGDDVGARLDVDAALEQLPAEFRVAVVLRDMCDLEYDEIARLLEIPIGTVRSRIARGRRQLAGELRLVPGRQTDRRTD